MKKTIKPALQILLYNPSSGSHGTDFHDQSAMKIDEFTYEGWRIFMETACLFPIEDYSGLSLTIEVRHGETVTNQ